MSDKKIEVQTKAVLIHAPGVGFVIRTGNGQAIAIAPGLAVDIANQILTSDAGALPPVPPRINQYLQ